MFESTFTRIARIRLFYSQSFTNVTTLLAQCLVAICCYFCDKKHLLRFAYLPHIARGSFEHSLNC